MSIQRIFAIVIRHIYVWPRNMERLMWSFGWPFVDIVIWGVTMSYLQKSATSSFSFVNVILGGLILWTIIWRTANEMAINFLDEVWNKNLINVFSTPLRPAEFILAMVILNFIKLTLTIIFMTIASWLFYKFNIIASFGFFLPILFFNLLMTGLAFGLFVLALILRFGVSVQELAWSLVAFIQPFSCVFYPLSALPEWGQKIAKFIPSTYVFEEMRTILFAKSDLIAKNTVNWSNLWISMILNTIYLTFALWFFYQMFENARENGRL